MWEWTVLLLQSSWQPPHFSAMKQKASKLNNTAWWSHRTLGGHTNKTGTETLGYWVMLRDHNLSGTIPFCNKGIMVMEFILMNGQNDF